MKDEVPYPIVYVTQAPLTPRQWLTGLAMHGLLANPAAFKTLAVAGAQDSLAFDFGRIAEQAYAMADAILAYETKLNDT